jgi:hypothetical protein
LGEFPEEIEADIQRFYPGRRIAEFWRSLQYGTNEMTLRELRVLVMHLPEESATACAYRGSTWSSIEYLLADLRDVSHVHRMEFVAANSKDGWRGPKFQPWPRPGETIEEEPHQITAREQHDQLLGIEGR